jgi:hypothetical protein
MLWLVFDHRQAGIIDARTYSFDLLGLSQHTARARGYQCTDRHCPAARSDLIRITHKAARYRAPLLCLRLSRPPIEFAPAIKPFVRSC